MTSIEKKLLGNLILLKNTMKFHGVRKLIPKKTLFVGLFQDFVTLGEMLI